jgi:UPF0755 protein
MKPARRSPLLVLAVLLAALSLWAAWQLYSYLHRPLPVAAAQEFDVERGSSLSPVVKQLAARHLLNKPVLLLAYVRVSGRGRHIQAGEYALEPGTTPLTLLDMLEQGRVITRSLTLVEGWTLRQARMLLDGAGHLQHELSGVPDDKLLAAMAIDKQAGRRPEGLFFPDTYVFSGKTSDRDILLRAYRRMQEVLDQEWRQRAANLPYRSPYDALIMASIVERETGVPAERADIAGVFVRRLQQGMLLQTDPTVIYGMGAAYAGDLRRRDLANRDNPYNTYLYQGLPPTPIALPGRAAIRAALQPADGDALYFVAKGDGSHQFSATLEAHQQAVKKYQVEQRRADYRSRPGAHSQ